jgi:hypothetical protein
MPLTGLLSPTQPLLNNYAYGSFTNSGPVTALGSALKVWLTADDHGTARMTDDGAGLISSWTSKDGSALTVTATLTARPTWSASGITSPTGNNVAALTFDGVANCLVSTTLTNVPTGSTARHIFALVRQDDLATSSLAIIKYGVGAATSCSLQKNGTTFPTLAVSDGTTTTATSRPEFYGVHACKSFWGSTTQQATFDGLPKVSGTIAALSTGTTRLRVGAGIAASAANFYVGAIRHIFITTTLTALQEMQLEAWMLWDCGWQRLRLPTWHPFRDRRP